MIYRLILKAPFITFYDERNFPLEDFKNTVEDLKWL